MVRKMLSENAKRVGVVAVGEGVGEEASKQEVVPAVFLILLRSNKCCICPQ